MKAWNRREKWMALALGLTLAFIWGNSLMPGAVSGAISDWVSGLMSRLLHLPVDTTEGHGVVRKLAHGTEYLVLGLETTALVGLWRGGRWSLVGLLGVLAALVDETIQLFVAGRAGQIRDVWIDLGGYVLGCGLLLALARLRRKKP